MVQAAQDVAPEMAQDRAKDWAQDVAHASACSAGIRAGVVLFETRGGRLTIGRRLTTCPTLLAGGGIRTLKGLAVRGSRVGVRGAAQ